MRTHFSRSSKNKTKIYLICIFASREFYFRVKMSGFSASKEKHNPPRCFFVVVFTLYTKKPLALPLQTFSRDAKKPNYKIASAKISFVKFASRKKILFTEVFFIFKSNFNTIINSYFCTSKLFSENTSF